MSYKSAKDVIIVSLSGLPVMMNKADLFDQVRK